MSEYSIKTKYGDDGRVYNSKFEAQFAAYLDIMGIKYKYEPGNKKLPNSKLYRPDFLIHSSVQWGGKDQEFYVEVKGRTPKMEEGIEKVRMFSEAGNRVFLFGPEWPWDLKTMRNDFVNDKRFHSNMFAHSSRITEFTVIQNLIDGWYEAQELDWVERALSERAFSLFKECIEKAMKTAFDYFVGKDAMSDKPSLTPKEISSEVDSLYWEMKQEEIRKIVKENDKKEAEAKRLSAFRSGMSEYIAAETLDHFIDQCEYNGKDFFSVIAQMISEWDRKFWDLFKYNKNDCLPECCLKIDKTKSEQDDMPF